MWVFFYTLYTYIYVCHEFEFFGVGMRMKYIEHCNTLFLSLFRFVMGVFIGGKQIADVSCSNKKDGRKEVADKALRALIASGDYKASSNASVSIVHLSIVHHTEYSMY